MQKIWIWPPRVLGVIFVLFLSFFSFDVFETGFSWPALLGFFVHSSPALAMLTVVLVSWKYELFGAIVFLLATVLYVLLVGFDRHWSWYVGISGPAVLIAVLYLVSWGQASRNKEI